MSENETANRCEGSCSDADAPGVKAAESQTSQVSCDCSEGSVSTANAPSFLYTSTKESALLDETKNPSPGPPEALKEERAKAEVPSMPSRMLSKPAVAMAPVNTTASSASVPSAPKIILSTTAVRSSAPLGARVVPAATAPSLTGLKGLGTLATHPSGIVVAPNQARSPTVTPAPVQGAIMAIPRTSTPQQAIAVARSPQTTSFQLPANFHIPQGMVLIRSDSGQLMLVSQQALAQAQAQGLVPKSPGATTIRPQSSQGTATATSIIRVSIPSSPVNVATIIKPALTTGTAILKSTSTSTTGTTIIKPSAVTGSAIIKPTTVLSTTGLKPSPATGSTVFKATATQKLSCSTPTGSISQKTTSGVTGTSVVKSIGKASLSPSGSQTIRPGGSVPRNICPNIPIKHSTTKTSNPIAVTAETLENVKKCKNFLVTLMKLASSGTRSTDMAQNVRALVKDLLDGKLEAEEFTDKLYMELRSSPQPYLVPFLKRSLPAVRQLTPNSQLFIQQCDQPKPVSTSASLSSISQKPCAPASTISQPFRGSLPAKPSQQVILQSKGVTVKLPATTLSLVDLPTQKPKQLVIQSNTQPAGTFGRQFCLQASKAPTSVPPPATHTHSFKDSTPGSFRDDDDINDVASMAGVNLNEENARILASSAQLVGSVVHSCRDEPFLQTPALQQRVLHIGRCLGVVEVTSDVLGLLSNATQERLRDLLEKLSAIAQHRNISCRDDWRHTQISDARSQLKFLEQLEKVEKQRREEEEREALLRIAKTRSSSEDPEQLRLKQRAKEMQQLELAQLQHREANLAALAALGPRKRKPLEGSGPGANQVLGSCAQRVGQRIQTRVTLRDFIFCLEQDPTLRHSHLLYKALLW